MQVNQRSHFVKLFPVLSPLVLAFSFLVAKEAVAQTAVSYAGRPFVEIGQSYNPTIGDIDGVSHAQLSGNQVVFLTKSGLIASGVFSGRGGPLTKIVGAGEILSGANFEDIYPGFACATGERSIVIASTGTGGAAVRLIESTNVTTIMAPGTILPHSDGQVATGIGEPFLAGGNVAVCAWHSLGLGASSFQGVYRIGNNTLEPVADTATALPVIGVPTGFSFYTKLGFDGQSIAFWATGRPSAPIEGIFLQSARGAAVIKIAGTGDTLPDGRIINQLDSHPYVSEGAVYFFVADPSSVTSLLKYQNGNISILATDGDSTPYGHLKHIGHAGLSVQNGTVFFPAQGFGGEALFSIENGTLRTIIPPGSTVGGFFATDMLLEDVAGDTIVLEIIAVNGLQRHFVANLVHPVVPVIFTNLTSQSVAAGTRVELGVTAAGDPPLDYVWYKNGQVIPSVTTDTFVIEAASPTDVATYQVDVSNPYGSIFSASVLLNLQTPPTIVTELTGVEIEEGDPISLGVVTGGGLPQIYSWQKNGENVINQAPGPGLFYRSEARLSDSGNYRVVVSNSWGEVTSTEAKVTINPAPPNPIYAGARFVSVLDNNTLAPPQTQTNFDTTALSETSVRWVGSQIVFTGQAIDHENLGIFGWENRKINRLLPPNVELPNALGIANGYQLVGGHPDDPLVIRATQLLNRQQVTVGIYMINGGSLQPLVDTTMEAPENTLNFGSFVGEASHAGGNVAFDETIDRIPSVFVWKNGDLSRILHADQELPLMGTLTEYLENLSYDGTNFLINALAFGRIRQVMLLVSGTGEVTRVIATGETVPDTSRIIIGFSGAGNDGLAFYLDLYDSSYSHNICSYTDGVLNLLLAKDMDVTSLGKIQSIESFTLQGNRGKVYSAAHVTTDSSTLQGIIASDGNKVEPVLFTAKLDGRRVANLSVCGVQQDRIIVLVKFEDGTRAYYVNADPVEEQLHLSFTHGALNTITFNVPNGATLETANTPDSDVWTTVASPEISMGAGNRFFRLRK